MAKWAMKEWLQPKEQVSNMSMIGEIENVQKEIKVLKDLDNKNPGVEIIVQSLLDAERRLRLLKG
tara:strand:- start:1588 stop:1782 length:195 start_codon:yes stop_codon:yes gene_type:complete